MRFLIITHVLHKKSGSQYCAYAPYVREMNIWLKYADTVCVIAPCSSKEKTEIDLEYTKLDSFIPVPAFSVIGLKDSLKMIINLPSIVFQLFHAMYKADHIHLRLPGNMGLLGSVVQLFFPRKPKTAKYAGNWDPHSKQPWSYRLQKYIVRNPILTRNMKVLVYGEWENQTKNIVPFFTATYSEKELYEIENKELSGTIHLIFVGTLTPNKRPLLAVETVKNLLDRGLDATLELYGEGAEREKIEAYREAYHLQEKVKLMGNQKAGVLKQAYQKAHFLLFASQSEGWPKVVAEAMLWKCVPITTPVSCVPYMLGKGDRGSLVIPEVTDIVNEIEMYRVNPLLYHEKGKAGYQWAKEFTLEKFESEIAKLLNYVH